MSLLLYYLRTKKVSLVLRTSPCNTGCVALTDTGIVAALQRCIGRSNKLMCIKIILCQQKCQYCQAPRTERCGSSGPASIIKPRRETRPHTVFTGDFQDQETR